MTFRITKYSPGFAFTFVKHLILYKHFLKPWPPEKDWTLAISRKDIFVAKTSKISINGSEHTVNWFLE